jgi:hypothetical protein
MSLKALLVSRQVAAAMLGGLHVGSVNKMILRGELERVFMGRRSMVTLSSVEARVRRARAETAARGRIAKPAELVRAGKRPRGRPRKVKSPALAPAL